MMAEPSQVSPSLLTGAARGTRVGKRNNNETDRRAAVRGERQIMHVVVKKRYIACKRGQASKTSTK